MIISLDAESLSQNSSSLHDKSPEETRNRRNEFQHNKAIYNKPIAIHCTKQGKPETISLKVRNEIRTSFFSILIQYSV
jgi:hypothetical protein